jgi:hypothetical protein
VSNLRQVSLAEGLELGLVTVTVSLLCDTTVPELQKFTSVGGTVFNQGSPEISTLV